MPQPASTDHALGAQTTADLAVATLKGLCIDAIHKANSGHPGMPLGCADMALVLWHHVLKFDPSDLNWPDRDRFILSAGHGSSLHYALLHLFDCGLTVEDLKQFRQLHSRTPGHPERGHTAGIEVTTGPLGQGLCNGVGMALTEAKLRAEFGADLVNHWVYVIAGDGCLMEGVTSEASSLAGHLQLGRLICLYDNNHISIDGNTNITFTEDVAARYRAYGWQVLHAQGTDKQGIWAALTDARADEQHPTLIIVDTVIGRGLPLQGTEKVHGNPPKAEEVAACKRAIGLDPDQFFAVDPSVYEFARAANGERQSARLAWQARVQSSPQGAALIAQLQPDFSKLAEQVAWPRQDLDAQLSTRKGGEKVLQALAPVVPGLLGGSADLGHSTFTEILSGGHVAPGNYAGRNVHWGVREHAMGSICNGIAAHGGLVPLNSTFLVFHDYMRPAVRLASLMNLQNIFVYTHDSIFVGEDGPTHQPIETLQAMRLIPGVVVLRPADLAETCAAWLIAMQRQQAPTILSLTRQNLPELPHINNALTEVARGAYILSPEQGTLELVLLATGSEVHLALQAQKILQNEGMGVRVVSMPSCELFANQEKAYRDAVLPPGSLRLSVEAGSTQGWQRWVGDRGASIGIDTFGASAPDKVLAKFYGFTTENVVTQAKALCHG